MSFLDTKSLCRAAQVNGQWHGKASQKDLWEALGISRWEIAMRQSMPEASSGFCYGPIFVRLPAIIISNLINQTIVTVVRIVDRQVVKGLFTVWINILALTIMLIQVKM